MKSQDLIRIGTQLRQAIDFHAGPVHAGRSATETATLESLVKRLALPDREHVAALIDSGRLCSLGPVHKNDATGPHRFAVADLDGIKREVLAEIAEQVIEEYDGEPDDLPAAVSAAIAAYLKSVKDGTAAKGFARVLPARARAFAARDPREERPGLLRRVATGAAVAGGLYAGASYLRGRKLVQGPAAPGIRGSLARIGQRLAAGNAANVADARRLAGRAAGFIRPRQFSALTPARVRALMLQYGRHLRRSA